MAEITVADILAALRESTSEHWGDPYIQEQEDGQFIVDSKFDLPKLARKLNEAAKAPLSTLPGPESRTSRD